MQSDIVIISVQSDSNFDKVINDYNLCSILKKGYFYFSTLFELPMYLNNKYCIRSAKIVIFTTQEDNRNVRIVYYLKEFETTKYRAHMIDVGFTYDKLKKYKIT